MPFLAPFIPAIAGVAGAAISANSASKSRDAITNAAQNMTTELLPYNFYGPGGQFAGFNNSAGAYPAMTSLPAGYGMIGGGNYGNNVLSGIFPQGQLGGQAGYTTTQPVGGGGLSSAGASILGRVPGNAVSLPQFEGGAGPRMGNGGFWPNVAGAAINNSAGGGASGDNTPRNISIGLGDLDPARAGLVGLGTNALGVAQRMGGLPDNVAGALAGVQGASGVPGMPNTFGLQNAVDMNLLNSMFAMNRGSAAPGLQDQAFAGASNQLRQAAQGFGDVRDQTLATLRAQAQPEEQRMYDQLQNDQFGMGRLGTTGGALQTEAFARGLGQADLSRQLAANQEARTTQQNALGLGQGLAGVGQNMAGLDENLLNSAFGRFSQTAGLSQGLTQERFGNSTLLNSMGYDRSQQNFANQIQAAGLPMALQGQQLQLALQALGGQSQLNDQGLSNFQAALAAAQAGANARIGSGSNTAALLNRAAQMPTGGDMLAQFLTGAGQRISDNGGLGGILGGLFGGGGNTPSNTPGDPGFQGPVRGQF